MATKAYDIIDQVDGRQLRVGTVLVNVGDEDPRPLETKLDAFEDCEDAREFVAWCRDFGEWCGSPIGDPAEIDNYEDLDHAVDLYRSRCATCEKAIPDGYSYQDENDENECQECHANRNEPLVGCRCHTVGDGEKCYC